MSATPAIKRVVEVSRSSFVRIKDAQLVIEQDGAVAGSIPVEDLGLLLIDSTAVVVSTAALVACWENNAPVVLCDRRHMPGAVLLPLEGSSLTSAVLAGQVAATASNKKKVWRQIIEAKIAAQAKVLETYGRGLVALSRLSKRAIRGDPSNIEAQAARLYWPRLFGKAFRRDPDDSGVNALLNYGYAVMRAAVARAICAAGMHPGLGVKHSNQYNAFCLADDLVEPLRPVVDLRVKELELRNEHQEGVTKATKAVLLELTGYPVTINGQSKPLLVACHEYAASIRRVLTGEARVLEIPQL